MLRWKFESGFNSTLRKQRVADLLEIHQILKKNSKELDLDKTTIQVLNNISKELEAFYISRVANYREFELLLQQLKSSSDIILTKGKFYKSSVRSLQNTILKIEPLIAQIIQKELVATITC